MPLVTQGCLLNCTYMQHATKCIAKYVHRNTVLETKAFLYLPGQIWSRCSAIYSIPSVYKARK